MRHLSFQTQATRACLILTARRSRRLEARSSGLLFPEQCLTALKGRVECEMLSTFIEIGHMACNLPIKTCRSVLFQCIYRLVRQSPVSHRTFRHVRRRPHGLWAPAGPSAAPSAQQCGVRGSRHADPSGAWSCTWSSEPGRIMERRAGEGVPTEALASTALRVVAEPRPLYG